MEFIDDIILKDEIKKYMDTPGDILTPYWTKWLSSFGLESIKIGNLTLEKYFDWLQWHDTPKKIERYCESITREEAKRFIWNTLYDAIKITNNYGDVGIFNDMVKESYRVYAFGAEYSDFAKNILFKK